MILSLFGFVVFTVRCFVLSCPLLFVSVFTVLFRILITSVGEERAGLCTSRAFVCLFCLRQLLSLFSSFSYQGFTAACDCGTPWTFLLTVFSCNLSHNNIETKLQQEEHINSHRNTYSLSIMLWFQI